MRPKHSNRVEVDNVGIRIEDRSRKLILDETFCNEKQLPKLKKNKNWKCKETNKIKKCFPSDFTGECKRNTPKPKICSCQVNGVYR